jgi:hypothetical protein
VELAGGHQLDDLLIALVREIDLVVVIELKIGAGFVRRLSLHRKKWTQTGAQTMKMNKNGAKNWIWHLLLGLAGIIGVETGGGEGGRASVQTAAEAQPGGSQRTER